MARKHHGLVAWQEAIALVRQIYWESHNCLNAFCLIVADWVGWAKARRVLPIVTVTGC